MAELKLNVSNPKTGKTKQEILSEDIAQNTTGKKIGDVIKGTTLNFEGYEFEVTGGSDNCGFPMRKDVNSNSRKKILVHKGIGFHNKRKEGLRKKRTIAGNTVGRTTAQLNVKIIKQGKTDMFKEEKALPKEETPVKE